MCTFDSCRVDLSTYLQFNFFSNNFSASYEHFKNGTSDKFSVQICNPNFYLSFLPKYHPDVNKQPGATEKFKEISAAYEV
jgi:hypothetical protein